MARICRFNYSQLPWGLPLCGWIGGIILLIPKSGQFYPDIHHVRRGETGNFPGGIAG
ncbi:hypothetical protein BO85DRAFT_211595 [Aspergillus piperis CBS 112811]|uniref:Uncharacterized protein n=1 Tax=Aspergillus piperis CBS 112811 TaxID=1448313 RepID=A0A8G1VHA1_9EURO|nr:hypothetical protein BO85DRAFT_211595 [Aspergillus piperis CBS 112811]RAH52027.1 hypothetical protein BO85DRAFT_211595 [Aspergillus piperis CBS 112811]